jgi:hypothetical protein
MATYNPLDSRFLTTANAITRDGQKFVRIILDTQDNLFYTLDDDGNFNPIGSGGTSSSGVTSINVGTGLSASSSTGAVTIVNTSPNQSVSISGGTDIEVTGSYPNFGINFTGTTSGVTGSAVVNVSNGVFYFPIWTATTPSSSAVTTTQLTYLNTFYKVQNGGIVTNDQFLVNSTFSIGEVNGYSFPTGVGNAGDILKLNNTAPPNALEFVSPDTIRGENIYGHLNGPSYTLTGLTNNVYALYEGEWTRYITNVVNRDTYKITANDPAFSGHILMFNVTGEVTGQSNRTIEIGWSYNDLTPSIIAGSNQQVHTRNGDPVANFNQTFFAEISQGSNEFTLFAKDITGNNDITLLNINVTISTIYSPLA